MPVTDASEADGPDAADGWVQSTDLPEHQTFLHAAGPLPSEDRRRAVVILAGSGRGRWTVLGLAGYEAIPRLAVDAEYEAAVAAAEEEMAAVEEGEPATADDDVRPPEEQGPATLRSGDEDKDDEPDGEQDADESDENAEDDGPTGLDAFV
jgi:hypothetical protein